MINTNGNLLINNNKLQNFLSISRYFDRSSWNARLVNWKHPEIFIKLAKALPEFQFKMGGSPIKNDPLEKLIIQKTRKMDNFQIIPFPNSIGEFLNFKPFELASIFINTSSSDGFSNTFVQSWARESPVISLSIDPDKVISIYELGLVCENKFLKMAEGIRFLMNNKHERIAIGKQCRSYADKFLISKLLERIT